MSLYEHCGVTSTDVTKQCNNFKTALAVKSTYYLQTPQVVKKSKFVAASAILQCSSKVMREPQSAVLSLECSKKAATQS